MSYVNTNSDTPEEKDPFVAGFETLRLRHHTDNFKSITTTSARIKTGKHNVPKKLKPIDALHFRICGFARKYFPNTYEPQKPTGRALHLEKGLVIGMHAGALSVPVLVRRHYFAHLTDQLDFEGELFKGYNIDTESLENATQDRHRNIGKRLVLPTHRDEVQQRIFEVGIGWMATVTSDFHEQVLDAHPIVGLCFTRAEQHRELTSALKYFKDKSEITSEILIGIEGAN